MSFPVLGLLVILPAAGAVVVALLPSRRTELILPVAAALSLLPLAVAGYLLYVFEVGNGGFQLTERVLWFEPWGISWNVGVDGVSLLLIALTAFLFPISILASASVTKNVKLYMIAMLVLETGLLGVFISLDLILFFVFFEITLVPMYLLIGIWGSANRVYAAVKFVLYTALGSALMLAGIISLGVIAGDQLGGITFDFRSLLDVDLSSTTQMWLFLAFGIAFAIKVPLFPLHTWLPDAHTEAPTAGSVLLAGVLLKLGTYGFVRFNLTLFPDATVRLAPWLATLAVIGIIYGGRGCDRATGRQAPHRVLLGEPPRVHRARHICAHRAGPPRRDHPDGQSRTHHGGAVSPGGHDLRQAPHERDRCVRRCRQSDAHVCRVLLVLGLCLCRAARSERLHRRVHGAPRELPQLPRTLDSRGVRCRPRRDLPACGRTSGCSPGRSPHAENEKLVDLELREVAILVPMVALIVFLGVYPKPALDRIEPTVESILDRIEATTSYDVPEFGRAIEVQVAGTEAGAEG